jgi:hypothetical protein
MASAQNSQSASATRPAVKGVLMNKASATTVLRILITAVLAVLFVLALSGGNASARPAADSPWDGVQGATCQSC